MSREPVTEAGRALLARVWPTDPGKCPVDDGGAHDTYGGICHCGWTIHDTVPGQARMPSADEARVRILAIEAEAAAAAEARTTALEAFALRVSRMGPCSQTHHGWIVLDARAALDPQEPGQ